MDSSFYYLTGFLHIGPGKAKFKVSPIPPATTHILTVTPKDAVLKKVIF